jgi:MOSC domain-containing protein YiiM
MTGVVICVARRDMHRVSKDVVESIRLISGEGVEGDAHRGTTVKHRSRVAKDPSQPNLRQVHLIHAELHDELAVQGFAIAPAQMGENILTRGVDLLGLATGTRLRIGDAIIEITGLRNPCSQLEGLAPGLMKACLDHAADGSLIRKAGVMGIVLAGGSVRAGHSITVEVPEGLRIPLQPV